MLFQQHVIRMCSHRFFPACWQVVNGLLTTCYRIVELNRLVTSCSNNLLSSCISTTCQITWALFQLIDKLNCYKPVANTSCWQVVRFLRVYRLHTFRVHGFMSWGRLFKARIGSNPGLKYNLLQFILYISARLLFQNFRKENSHWSTQYFWRNISKFTEQAVGKFALNCIG
jgi:hypothetical protein